MDADGRPVGVEGCCSKGLPAPAAEWDWWTRMQPADRDLAVGYDAAERLCLQLCIAVIVHRKHAQVLCRKPHAPFAGKHA